MSGILRNLLTVLCSIFRYGSERSATVTTNFVITPLDTGIAVLKSDRYLQLAEAAQLDMLIRTGLIGILLRSGYQFVNLAQLIKFARPVPVFSRVTVVSHVAYWDEKSAVFEHLFSLRGAQCARVLVRMKFKRHGRTVAPSIVLGTCLVEKPRHLTDWENLISIL